MSDYERLSYLAGLYGIGREYYDIWGNLHVASEDTLVRVLAEMGVEAGDTEAVERAIGLAETAAWLRPLEPVHVFREGAAVSVALSMPVRLKEEVVRWRFAHEDGRAELGSVTPSGLDEAERGAMDGEEYVRYILRLPAKADIGYHTLVLSGSVEASASVIVAPERCYTPDALRQGGRIWGVALQLYSLRSDRNWGMGDFTDLSRFIEVWSELGADIIGVNPLHALFPHNTDCYSPYYPSSRRFINVMYVDPCAVEDYAECEEAARLYDSPGFRERLNAARQTELVDNRLVYPLKLEMLELLYKSFVERHVDPGTQRAREYREFIEERGEALRLNSLFEALQEKFVSLDPSKGGWMDWPEEYRNPSSAEVAQFAKDHADRVGFHSYLQWQATVQLSRAGRVSAGRGLKVGIYQDLAVGCSANGAESWIDRPLYALGISVGSPPDDFNLRGQSWGIPPLVPSRLRDEAYAPFIETIRCTMRDAGAIRLDHIMGLMRLFWVTPCISAAEGVYVSYPMEDLMGIVSLESVRNRCLVIGEDLGTVPPEVPREMQARDMLSFRVFYWAMDSTGGYMPPGDYQRAAVVTVGTHDLPTLSGYWRGLDIDLRHSLGAFPNPEVMEGQIRERLRCKTEMLRALGREGLLPGGIDPDNPSTVPEVTAELSAALHRYIARSGSRVMTVQLEDAVGQDWQVNLPGTGPEHPNWRSKVAVPVEEMASDARIRMLAGALNSERTKAM